MGQSICDSGVINHATRKRCQKAADEHPQGREPTAVGTRTRATARVGVASPRGTATPMQTAPPTTTMGPAMASTTLLLATQSSGGQAYSTHYNYNAGTSSS